MADEIGSLVVRVGIDSNLFQEGITGINKKMSLLKSEFNATSSKLKDFGSENDKLTNRISFLNSAMDIQKAKVQSLAQAYEKAKLETGENSKATQELGIKLNNAIGMYNKFENQLKNATTELSKNNDGWLNLSKNLKESGDLLKTTGNKVEAAGDSILRIAAPLVVAGAATIKFANDFEDGLAKISTIADTTETSMGELGAGVIDLSNKTGKSVNDLNEGLYQAISSGVKTGEALTFMEVAAKTAVGGFTDTETAVDGLTTVLNAYGMETNEASKIANQMVVTQNLGKVTVDELAKTIGNAIPTFSSAGISTEEFFSSLGVLTATGIKASEAVTGMKSALSNIIKPTKEASDAAASLKLNFDSEELKSKGWMGFLQEVKGKLKETNPEYVKSAEQVATLTAKQEQLSKANMTNTDEYKKNSVALKGAKGDMKALESANKGQISAFATMFGSVEALNSVLTLTSDQGVELYNESIKQMGNGADYVADAYDKVSDTSSKSLNKTLNELKNAGMKLGETLQPAIEQVTSILGDLTGSLNKLDEPTLKAITNVALFTLTLGGALKIGGNVVKTVGGIADVFSNLSRFLGIATVATEGVEVAAGTAATGGLAGLGTALGGIAVAAAPYLLVAAALAGTGYLIYKGMTESAIPAVDLFADKIVVTGQQVAAENGLINHSTDSTVTKISEGTKKAVGAYIKLDDEATKALDDLYINSVKITEDTVTNLVGKYIGMGNQIKIGLDKSYNDAYSTMEQFYQISNVLSDTEETATLAKMQANNDKKKADIDAGTKEIQDILKQASSENRALTSDEQQKINKIQQDMKTNAVQTLSESEVESKVILERLKGYSENLTKEQASEEVKNANAARDGTVTAANEKYDKTVKEIIRMRDESHIITAEQADLLIADAEKQKNETIDKAEEQRKQVVEKITSMDADVWKDVDITTGKIATAWEKLKKWWDEWTPTTKTTKVENQVTGLPWDQTQNTGNGTIWSNWTGNENFQGGFTTLHEKGFELYDLPSGTRIFNHDASEALVRRTAQEVAANMLSGNGTQTIIVPVNIDGRQIAQVVAENQSVIDRYNNYRIVGGVETW